MSTSRGMGVVAQGLRKEANKKTVDRMSELTQWRLAETRMKLNASRIVSTAQLPEALAEKTVLVNGEEKQLKNVEILRGQDLKSLNFSGLNLGRLNLGNANLSHANLVKANLSNANLFHANLTDVSELTLKELKKAHVKNTIISLEIWNGLGRNKTKSFKSVSTNGVLTITKRGAVARFLRRSMPF